MKPHVKPRPALCRGQAQLPCSGRRTCPAPPRCCRQPPQPVTVNAGIITWSLLPSHRTGTSAHPCLHRRSRVTLLTAKCCLCSHPLVLEPRGQHVMGRPSIGSCGITDPAVSSELHLLLVLQTARINACNLTFHSGNFFQVPYIDII